MLEDGDAYASELPVAVPISLPAILRGHERGGERSHGGEKNDRAERLVDVYAHSSHPRIVGGGAVDGRDFPAHRTQISRELSAVVDRVEQESVQHVAER